jgi:DNA adenine methylase
LSIHRTLCRRAGVALCLLLEGWVSTVHINDADIAVYSFWKSLVDHPDELLNFIDNVKVTMDTWHEKKYILENASLFQTMELGFATFFLNRTNRSGILKGGVIGGKEQNGNYKLDARFNKTNLLERIKKSLIELIKSLYQTAMHPLFYQR